MNFDGWEVESGRRDCAIQAEEEELNRTTWIILWPAMSTFEVNKLIIYDQSTPPPWWFLSKWITQITIISGRFRLQGSLLVLFTFWASIKVAHNWSYNAIFMRHILLPTFHIIIILSIRCKISTEFLQKKIIPRVVFTYLLPLIGENIFLQN